MAKPKSLGRGIYAIIPPEIKTTVQEFTTEKSVKFHNAKLVPINCIRPNPKQPRLRFSVHALNELAESIRTHGVLTPLLVRKDGLHRYILIAGERRLRAAGLAEQEYVPVIVHEQVSDQQELELALVENLQREDLDPIEMALAYQRLIDEFNLTQAQVGARLGKARATVANTVRLLKLPVFLQEELRAGKVTSGHCKSLLTLGKEELQKQALHEIYENHLTVREVEALVKKMIAENNATQTTNKRPKLLASQLESKLDTHVKIEGATRGKIVIEYNSIEDIERIFDQLMNVEKTKQ